jgi:hypothetical protein
MVPIFHPLDWIELSQTQSQVLAVFPRSKGCAQAQAAGSELGSVETFSVAAEALGVSCDVVFTTADDLSLLGWTINFPIDPDDPDQAADVGGVLYQRVVDQLGAGEVSFEVDQTDDEFVVVDARWWPKAGRCLRIVTQTKQGPRQAPRASLLFSLMRVNT